MGPDGPVEGGTRVQSGLVILGSWGWGWGNKKPRQIRGYPFVQIKVEGVLEAAQICGC